MLHRRDAMNCSNPFLTEALTKAPAETPASCFSGEAPAACAQATATRNMTLCAALKLLAALTG